MRQWRPVLSLLRRNRLKKQGLRSKARLRRSRYFAILFMTVRLILFVWRFQVATRSAPRFEALGRRYLVLQLLRVRISRFVVDLLQITVLVGVLYYLLRLHWR